MRQEVRSIHLSFLNLWLLPLVQGVKWSTQSASEGGSSAGGLTPDSAQLAGTMAAAILGDDPGLGSLLGGMEGRRQQLNTHRSRAPLPHSSGSAGAAGAPPSGWTEGEERAVALEQLQREVFGAPTEASATTTMSQGGVAVVLSDTSSTATIAAAAAAAAQGAAAAAEQAVQAVRSSSRWPRIYRPPRARGGHVILDLCVHDAAAAVVPEGAEGAEAGRSTTAVAAGQLPLEAGRLERHVSTGKCDALAWSHTSWCRQCPPCESPPPPPCNLWTGTWSVRGVPTFLLHVLYTPLNISTLLVTSLPQPWTSLLYTLSPCQTVTKSDAQGWMGKAAWRLSREVRRGQGGGGLGQGQGMAGLPAGA